MATVKFTSNLKRFYPELSAMELEANTVADLLEQINQKHNGIRDYIVDEQGRLRKHVNIFIGNNLIKDKETLADSLSREDEVYIMQALSGG